MGKPTALKFFTDKDSIQQGQKCPQNWVAQAAIRLATAVIKFRNKERNVKSPSSGTCTKNVK